MLARLRFAKVAELELSEAIVYYDEKANKGLAFAREVHRVIDHAMHFPGAGTIVEHEHIKRPIHRHRLNPAFPYDVIAMTVQEQSLLLVLAIAHHSREPSYWLDRLPKSPR